MLNTTDTIFALSTPAGMSAISLIRISGDKALEMVDSLFKNKKGEQKLFSAQPNKAYFGSLFFQEEFIDDVVITFFKAPKSYTGQDIVEIACHGSTYIQQRILYVLSEKGARPAEAGEFSMRAFLNGKMDLSQTEAVADLISSQSKSSHRLAVEQLKGGYSLKIKDLRRKFVDLASLLELELDFSDEEVEFASRTELQVLLETLESELTELIDTFSLGNALKNGIPVAILGKPNVGKSTLLNALLNEERAIVSDIPGTTRDTIEDTLNIKGTLFRFIDTAGIRNSSDIIENYGIERSYKSAEKSTIILYLLDSNDTASLRQEIDDLQQKIDFLGKKLILVANKIDLSGNKTELGLPFETLFISAKNRENINLLKQHLNTAAGIDFEKDRILVSNVRHYQSMKVALENVLLVKEGMENDIPFDLLMTHIRTALHEIGSIVGEVSNDEILGNIFGKFCIGK